MNKPASELIALQAERAELMAKNAAATSWGAAVGARHERIKGIDGLLAANQSGSERAGVLNWYDINVRPSPKDRPIGLLSIQPQAAGGMHVTFDVCQWNTGVFEIGYGFKSGVGHGCATHWCEVADLRLPLATPPAQPAPAVTHGKPDGAVREAATAFQRLAADCHRSKWQFDINKENAPNVYEARRLVRKAFDELRRIGNIAMHERDALHSPKIAAAETNPGDVGRTAPITCPNCHDESDCSNVDICNAVEAAYSSDVKAEAKSQEPDAVAWQYRTGWENGSWTNWTDCSREIHDSLTKHGRLGSYLVETRSLYTHPTTKPEAPAVSVDAIKAALRPFIGHDKLGVKVQDAARVVAALIAEGR